MYRILVPFLYAIAVSSGPALAQESDRFGFLGFGGQLELAENACGEGAATYLSDTAMDLVATWTMEFGPEYGAEPARDGDAPNETVPVLIDAHGDTLVLGGATFPSEVPLEVWQGDEIPFAGAGDGEGLRSEAFARTIGCEFDRLARMTASGAYLRDETAVPFVLVLALVNPRVMVGMAQTTEDAKVVTRLVRLTR